MLDLLLVEPNAEGADALTPALGEAAAVAQAATLSEARALLSLRPFDIIITEYHLPDGYGFNLVGSDCPLLMFTTERDPHAIIRAMHHGVTRYHLKGEATPADVRLAAIEAVGEYRSEQVSHHLNAEAGAAGRLRMTMDCQPVSCGQQAAHTLGYADDVEALNQPTWRGHFPPELQTTWQEASAHNLVVQNVHATLYDRNHQPVSVLCNIATLPRPDEGYVVDIVLLTVGTQAEPAPLEVGLLRHSHAWIKHILDNTSDVILVTDVAGRIQHVNNRFNTLFDVEPPDTVFDLFPTPANIATLMDDATAYSMRLTDEAVIQREDGDILYVEVSIVAVDGGGGQRRLLVTLHDITAYKKAAERLAQSEADLRAIFESTSVGFMLLDTDMSIRTANGLATDIVQKIMGHSLTEHERMGDLLMPEYMQAFADAFQRAMGGRTLTEEVSVPVVSGEDRNFALTFIPVQNEENRIIGVCLSTEDITARKRAERALSASESRYRAITELISDYAYAIRPEVDGTLRLAWLTEVPFRRVTGYEATGLRTIDDIIDLVVLPEDRDRALRDMSKCLQGQTTSGEYRIVTQRGNTRWVHVTRRPIWDETTGSYDTIIGAVRDITTQRKMEQALRDALEQERELNELKSRFIAMVSHEFRTPLATIRASNDMLRTYFDRLTPTQREERFDRIALQVGHMTTLMEDVLSFGRFEAGASPINKVEGDIAGFLAALVEEFSQTYPTHTIDCRLPEQRVTVGFDRNLMRQVTLNLLTNAQKYSEPGSTIILTLEASPTMVEISVRDSGIGIPESDLQELFTAFHRASNVGTIQGTGLGLSITKHAVELHGGHITVASEAGHGSTFTVTLPRRLPQG